MKIGMKTKLSAAALLLSLWVSPGTALAQESGSSTAAPALPAGLHSLIDVTTESSCLLCDAYEQRPLSEIKAGFSALCNASLPEKHRLVQVNLVDSLGRSPLLLATKANDLEGVKFFLTNSCQGADVNIANHNGRTPLMWAAQHGNLEMVNALIEKRANVSAAKGDGTTVLDYAVRNQRREVAYKLYTSGASVTANAETLKRLSNSSGITDGKRIITDILFSGHVNFPYQSERSLLIWSARNGEKSLAEALVSDGANKETLDHLNSEKAYRVAVRAGHFETAGVIGPKGRPFNTFRYALTASVADLADLAEKSDNPNLAWGRSVHWGSPISVALIQSIYDNNRVLFDAQIADNVDVTLSRGYYAALRPLGWAVYRGRIDMAEILLKKGAPLSEAGYEGPNPASLHGVYWAFAGCRENNEIVHWALNKIDRWPAILNERSTYSTLGQLLESGGCLGFEHNESSGRANNISALGKMAKKGLNFQVPASPIGYSKIYPVELSIWYAPYLIPRLLEHGASCSTSRPHSTGPIFPLDFVDRAISQGRTYWSSRSIQYDNFLRARTELEAGNCTRTPRPLRSAPAGGVAGESEADPRQQERNEALDEVIRQLEEAMEQRPASPFPEGQ